MSMEMNLYLLLALLVALLVIGYLWQNFTVSGGSFPLLKMP